MDLDDLEPKKAKAYELGQDLAKLSVGELAALIETLKAEIARVETDHGGQAILEERRRRHLQALRRSALTRERVPLGKSRLSINALLGVCR